MNIFNNQPLPEPKLLNHQLGLVALTWGQFHRKWSRYLSLMWICKITNLELQQHLPGANELNLNTNSYISYHWCCISYNMISVHTCTLHHLISYHSINIKTNDHTVLRSILQHLQNYYKYQNNWSHCIEIHPSKSTKSSKVNTALARPIPPL